MPDRPDSKTLACAQTGGSTESDGMKGRVEGGVINRYIDSRTVRLTLCMS